MMEELDAAQCSDTNCNKGREYINVSESTSDKENSKTLGISLGIPTTHQSARRESSEDSELDGVTQICCSEDSSDDEKCYSKNCEQNSNRNDPVALVKKRHIFHITPQFQKDLMTDKAVSKSQVIVNKQTDSLKNILAYDSSDDSDFEKNWQLHESRQISLSPNSDTESEHSYDSENEVGNTTSSKNAEQDISKKSKLMKKDWFDDEYVPPLPDISQLKIDVHKEEFLHVGSIASIIDKLVTVETIKGTPAFDLDTYLFIEKEIKIPLGMIFDVLGPISAPIYVVRFNSNDDIIDIGLKNGMNVFAAHKSEYSKYVFVKQLMSIKGSDASWKGDQEIPPEMVEFSDDEEEHHVRGKRNVKRKHSNVDQYRQYEQIMNQCNVINTRACHDFCHYQGTQGNGRGRINVSQNIQYMPLFNPAVPPPGFTSVGVQRHHIRLEAEIPQNCPLPYYHNMPQVFPHVNNWSNVNCERFREPGPSAQH